MTTRCVCVPNPRPILLCAEMDDLAASLFEQAHEMVRQEKMARFQAEKQLKEERSKSEVCSDG